ncbi:hypothetical protein CLV24_1208 [Pontibacter ummariensis]|uniref:Uncharacterized protein n=2 Tax=Pontibacter ummariensis TaxID=1610492 RepID=A0A239J270_9BACT|nr:hypothetical protein CLV24_1208 [Pontibacter ummariensis]SNS99910.1 hypothetical protein SAMN06296052_1207 [Pontibacter ummariensis]
MHKAGVSLLIILLTQVWTLSAFAQDGNAVKHRTAVEGDTVWVVVNHVKPEKREQFERFVYDIFWPAAKKLDPKAQRAFDNTRILNPAVAEADGTFTYVFLMDPLISGEDYWIDSLLGKMFPEKEAEEYYRLFRDALARDGEHYAFVQSRYWGGPSKK